MRAARILLLRAMLLFLPACGIEVGNPHGGGTSKPTPSTAGDISISLADAPIDDAQHVYLTLAAISVVPLNADGSSGSPVTIPLAAGGKVDVLALQGGKSLDLTTAAQSLPVGNYAGVILDLDQQHPASIVPRNGTEENLPIAGQGHDLYVSQQFEVAVDQPLTLTLHLDLRSSITSGSGGQPFGFSPVASLVQHDQESTMTGTGIDASITEVCAYLFRPEQDNGPLHHPGGPDPNGSPAAFDARDARGASPPGWTGSGSAGASSASLALESGSLPPDWITAKAPPSFGPGQSFDPMSDDSSCATAFATAQVSGGGFALDHLWPGRYELVYYHADGTRDSDGIQQVTVAPGATATVTGTGVTVQ